MKIRNGFVSNSSSSSFIIVREALSNKDEDMVINYEDWIKFFIKTHNSDNNLEDKFEYYDTDPWNIKVHDDYIFGETSMDNFNISSYFNFINIDKSYIKWDEGYCDEPYHSQLVFIKEAKKRIRKEKINNINDNQ